VGIKRFHEELRGLRVLILVDNTSALYRVRKASRSDALKQDVVAKHIVELAYRLRFDWSIRYVASEENVADAPSRMREVDLDLVEHTLQLARGRIGKREGKTREGGVPVRVSNPSQ
jgi:hypothetical protein